MTGDLQRLLGQWQADVSLFEPRQLARRIEVLDQLDVHFGHAESGLSSSDPANAAIIARAGSLRTRLESANAAVCASIRKQIQQGCPDEFHRHLSIQEEHPTTPGLGYDFLDELVSGTLQLRAPEETNHFTDPEMVFYQPTPARHILRLVALAGFFSSDVLVDIGSGLGHVPIVVSILTGTRSIGIEVNPALLASARGCARSLGLDRVSFMEEDARTADLSAGTVFYLYTPFTGALLRAVLERLRSEAATRFIQIATLGPCTTVAASEAWLSTFTEPDPDRISLFHSRT